MPSPSAHIHEAISASDAPSACAAWNTITADAAQRRRTEEGVVDLVNPIMRDSKGAELKAPTGYYDRDKGVLELYEAVNITDSAGYSFISRGARMVGDGALRQRPGAAHNR